MKLCVNLVHEHQSSFKSIVGIFINRICNAVVLGLLSSEAEITVPQLVAKRQNK